MDESPELKEHWSNGEKVAVAILVSILILAVTFLGLAYYANTVGFCGALGPEPCPGLEAMNLVSSTLDSPTNATIRIMNTGSAAISLVSYYVKDTYGNGYSSANWSGPSLSHSAIASTGVLLDGKNFTFQSGSSYTVILVTSRNDQFVFSVTF